MALGEPTPQLTTTMMLIFFGCNILLIGFVTMLIGIAGLNKLVVDVNIANFFKEDTEFRNSIDFIDEQMTGTMDIRVRVEGNLKDPLALYEVEKIQTLLEKNSSVTTSFSIADALKQMHRILMDDDPEFDEHLLVLGRVFTRARVANLRFKLDKCFFAQWEIETLGMIAGCGIA